MNSESFFVIMGTLVIIVIIFIFSYFLYKSDSDPIRQMNQELKEDDIVIEAYRLYYEEQKNKKAYNIFLKFAKQGNALAQLGLGEMYLEGDYLTQNDREAFTWIEKSAKQDNREALLVLGQMYKEGIGTKKDIAKANFYTKKADELR